MNIRHRIILLVMLAFVAIGSIGGYAMVQSWRNATSVRLVTEGVVPSALASADLVSALKDIQLAVGTLVTTREAGLAAQNKDRLASGRNALSAALDLQLAQATGPAQQGLVRQARESYANYVSAIDETAALKLGGQQALAEASLYANVDQYQHEMEKIIETLRVEKNRSKDEAIAELNRSLSRTAQAVSIATVLAFALLGAVGTLLYRQITIPIRRMQAAMSEIAQSQDFTRRVPIEREDEIGHSVIAFNRMVQKIEESSGLLRTRTKDMQAMLQNMPQGILTVVAGNRVHPEYSAFLETILETREIAGRDVMEVLFSNTSLGADVLAQIEAVGGACIGEDLMNFEFNAHLMVREVHRTMPDGRVRILDLGWSPITGEDERIERLMLCVRDVTELRQLAAEASAQKRELEVIGEILSVTQEKFHQFIENSLRTLLDNECILRDHPVQDPAALATLLRNMHTLKGNARTYGLHHLTDLVHGAEQAYDELRQPVPARAWDQAALLAELAGVRAAVEHYARVNEEVLGRRGPGRRGGVERYLLVDRAQIGEALQRLEAVDRSDVHELVAVRDSVHRLLAMLGTEPIADVLEGVLASLPGLARELGKEPPVLRIEDNGYVVRNQAGGTLRNVFTHLLRNALDHGLETADERTARGKPAAGTLSLRLGVQQGMFQLVLRDDGRGLALARIRELALERGLIAPADVPGDEQVAALVFHAGFSTAARVTAVSGRGVGMDAVHDLLQREQGRIEIRFTDAAVGAPFRQCEFVVMLPEDLALQVDAGTAVDRQVPAALPAPLARLAGAGPDAGGGMDARPHRPGRGEQHAAVATGVPATR